MKKYFYLSGNDRIGPLDIHEILNSDIQPSTLIWYYGIGDWTRADQVSELNELFALRPPPVPIDITNRDNSVGGVFKTTDVSNEKIEKSRSFLPPSMSFKGRIGTGEYRVAFVVWIIEWMIHDYFEKKDGLDNSIYFILVLPLMWFTLSQGARRCHDLGNSGWYQLVPFYVVPMLFTPGQMHPNKYDEVCK